MRIGIDATLVRPDRLTGVERYASCLIQALARRAPREIVLFCRPDAPAAIADLPVEKIAAPFAARVPVDQGWLPWAAARARVDLLHNLAFPTPVLWRGRSILTLHDATPWLYPDALSTGMRFYYRPLYGQALRRAAAICTVSAAARADLSRALDLSPDRIHVTHNGVSPAFFDARAPQGPRAPYLLAVGTLEPRKNLAMLIEAFRLLRGQGRDLQLKLVGRQGWADSLPLGELAPHVQLTGQVDDTELPGLYAGSACFVFPSLYEGFGLPLAEAMAAGAPGVASDIPALREVGGDTVQYADPQDPEAFAAAIADTLDDPTGTRNRALAGRERALQFSWDACAEATLAVYRSVPNQ